MKIEVATYVLQQWFSNMGKIFPLIHAKSDAFVKKRTFGLIFLIILFYHVPNTNLPV